jgi:hypothetical protein
MEAKIYFLLLLMSAIAVGARIKTKPGAPKQPA